jgi:hypothetical protein
MIKINTTLLFLTIILSSFFNSSRAQQSTFTADLGIYRTDQNPIVLNYGDSAHVDFYITNLGMDDIDTSNYIVYGMTNLPQQYFLIVQDEMA